MLGISKIIMKMCSYETKILFYLFILQVTTKREQLEEKSSGARNDYLLSLAAANAHQTRYFVIDFQNTITVGGYLLFFLV